EHGAGLRDLHAEPGSLSLPARVEYVADGAAPAGAGHAVSLRPAGPHGRGRVHRPRALRQPRAVPVDAPRRLGDARAAAAVRAAARARRAVVVGARGPGHRPLARPPPAGRTLDPSAAVAGRPRALPDQVVVRGRARTRAA